MAAKRKPGRGFENNARRIAQRQGVSMTRRSPVARAVEDALAPLVPWVPLVAIEAGVWAWQQLGSAPLALVVVAHLVVAPRAAVILLPEFRGCVAELRCWLAELRRCLAEFRLVRREWRRTFGTPPRRRSQDPPDKPAL